MPNAIQPKFSRALSCAALLAVLAAGFPSKAWPRPGASISLSATSRPSRRTAAAGR
ncbi:MAG: hypothetical protein M5R42_04975 [Rhodocyclaceae bacterium]|nr:hypothetical protein [Rhodocyclaceae bacterium]